LPLLQIKGNESFLKTESKIFIYTNNSQPKAQGDVNNENNSTGIVVYVFC
jgi:hypothetical protein